MHATSTGKALIAFDEHVFEQLDADLEPLTASTIVDRVSLAEQLRQIRRRGFAETIDELEVGFSGVATVLRGGLGEVLGALSICGPTQRMTATRRAQLGQTLQAAAQQLQPA